MSLPINEPRYQLMLRKLFGLRGVAELNLEDSVIASVQLAGTDPEDFFDKSEALWYNRFNVPGSVGNVGQSGLINPAGSNMVAIVEAVSIQYAAAAGVVQMGTFADVLPFVTVTGTSPGMVRDTRLAKGTVVPPPSMLCVGRNTVAVNLLGTPEVDVNPYAGAATVLWVGPWVIGPGHSFLVEGTAANTVLAGSLRWRESPVSPDELIR